MYEMVLSGISEAEEDLFKNILYMHKLRLNVEKLVSFYRNLKKSWTLKSILMKRILIDDSIIQKIASIYEKSKKEIKEYTFLLIGKIKSHEVLIDDIIYLECENDKLGNIEEIKNLEKVLKKLDNSNLYVLTHTHPRDGKITFTDYDTITHLSNKLYPLKIVGAVIDGKDNCLNVTFYINIHRKRMKLNEYKLVTSKQINERY